MDAEVQSDLSPAVHYSIAFIYILFGLLSFSLNSIVLFTFVMDHSLLFPANLLVLSLATADWLIGVVANPMGGIANASGSGAFVETSYCTFYAFFTTFVGLGAMLHHAAFAVDRYLVISRPMASRHSMGRMLAVIGFLWSFSFLWSLFPLLSWSAYVPEGGNIACSIRWQSTRSSDTSYIVCLFIFFYFVPLAIIVFCYTFVYLNVRFMTRNAQKIWGTNAAATLETVQASWKMAKIAIVMVVGFFVAWTPYAVVSFYAAFGFADNVPTLVAAIPALFAKTSTFYNPIIYFFAYKSFRESLVKSWRRYRNRNAVMPFNQASHSAFVISARDTRAFNDSTSVEEIPFSSVGTRQSVPLAPPDI